MDVSEMARTTGRRGGRARARRLPGAARKHIASLGGKARVNHSWQPVALPTISDTSPHKTRFEDSHRPSAAWTASSGGCPGSIPREPEMTDPVDHLQAVGEIVQALRGLGLEPVLVGGMALVILASRRVTRDFDFVISHPGDRLPRMFDVFYDRRLELARS